MPFVFEQPNLDNPGEGYLYFDPGDGRLITTEAMIADKPAKEGAGGGMPDMGGMGGMGGMM